MYITVLLLKKYLTSKIEKKKPQSTWVFLHPPDLGKTIFKT